MGNVTGTTPYYDYSGFASSGDYAGWQKQIFGNYFGSDQKNAKLNPYEAFGYYNDYNSMLKTMELNGGKIGVLGAQNVRALSGIPSGGYEDWLKTWGKRYGSDWTAIAQKYANYNQYGSKLNATASGGLQSTPPVTRDDWKGLYQQYFTDAGNDPNQFSSWWDSLLKSYVGKYGVPDQNEELARLNAIFSDPSQYYKEGDKDTYQWQFPWEINAYNPDPGTGGNTGGNTGGSVGSEYDSHYDEAFDYYKGYAWQDFVDKFGSDYGLDSNSPITDNAYFQQIWGNLSDAYKQSPYYGGTYNQAKDYQNFITWLGNQFEGFMGTTPRPGGNNTGGDTPAGNGEELPTDWNTWTSKNWAQWFEGLPEEEQSFYRGLAGLRGWTSKNSFKLDEEDAKEYEAWLKRLGHNPSTIDAMNWMKAHGYGSNNSYLYSTNEELQKYIIENVFQAPDKTLKGSDYATDLSDPKYNALKKQAEEGYGRGWERSAYESAISPYVKQYGDFARSLQMQQGKTGLTSGFANQAKQDAKYGLSSQGISALSGIRQQNEDARFQAKGQLEDIGNANSAIYLAVDQWNKEYAMQQDQQKLYYQQADAMRRLYEKEKAAGNKEAWMSILQYAPYVLLMLA